MQDADWVAAQFTRRDGAFRFARWGRPLAPAVIGLDERSAQVFGAAIRAVAGLAGLEVAPEDPDLGANLLIIAVEAWDDLHAGGNLARLIPNLADLTETLAAHDANQYRTFNFDAAGAICLCVALLRYDAALRAMPVEAVAVGQAVQAMLLWSDGAFMEESPLAATGDGRFLVKPVHGALLRAAYDPALPAASRDPALARDLAGRMAPRDDPATGGGQP